LSVEPAKRITADELARALAINRAARDRPGPAVNFRNDDRDEEPERAPKAS